MSADPLVGAQTFHRIANRFDPSLSSLVHAVERVTDADDALKRSRMGLMVALLCKQRLSIPTSISRAKVGVGPLNSTPRMTMEVGHSDLRAGAHNLEKGDGVASEPRQRRSHRGEIISRELKFLKSVKVENIGRATCVNHDPLHLGVNHPHRDQGIIVVWVEVLRFFFLKGFFQVVLYLGCFSMVAQAWALKTRGAISSRGRSTDDDVDLPLYWPLRSGRWFLVPSDKLPEVSLTNEIFVCSFKSQQSSVSWP
ncbi:hypothetical protein BHE74_00027469 [Ensete ventricosum]|nr:hypothetical protein GW17_00016453 [Ensete ventricosum]RWW65236.1 hypothetical protein BHE74_00027469 [Ensete ventricosum]